MCITVPKSFRGSQLWCNRPLDGRCEPEFAPSPSFGAPTRLCIAAPSRVERHSASSEIGPAAATLTRAAIESIRSTTHFPGPPRVDLVMLTESYLLPLATNLLRAARTSLVL